MNKPILEVNNLCVQYGKDVILDGISFSLNAGECLAVTGPNGSGKTTLLRAISGYLKSTKGTVSFQGMDISQLPPWRRTRIGLVHVLEGGRIFPSLTVEENIQAALKADSPFTAAALNMVYDLMPQLASNGIRKQPAGALSGGERQLLVLARAVVMKPKAVLLDSPFLGVGESLRDTLGQCLRNWIEEASIAIVLVEHNIVAARNLSARIFPMTSSHRPA